MRSEQEIREKLKFIRKHKNSYVSGVLDILEWVLVSCLANCISAVLIFS